MKNRYLRYSGILLLLTILIASGYSSLSGSANEDADYYFFPNDGTNIHSDDEKLQLALTASKGTQVSMSYTPATYEISLEPGKEYVELQIKDATLQVALNSS